MWTDGLIKGGQQDKKELPKIMIHSILSCAWIPDYAFKIPHSLHYNSSNWEWKLKQNKKYIYQMKNVLY